MTQRESAAAARSARQEEAPVVWCREGGHDSGSRLESKQVSLSPRIHALLYSAVCTLQQHKASVTANQT